MFSENDTNILRKLAFKIRTFADSSEMILKRKNIRNNNDLIKNSKPLILCYPEGAWNEIFKLFPLECTSELAQTWERRMLMSIFTHEFINDDQAHEPFFDIGWHMSDTGYGVEIEYHSVDERGSYSWKSALNNLNDDLKLLKPIKFFADKKKTINELEQAQELFGDILPSRIRGFPFWSMGFSSEAIRLIGLEGFMLNMYDNPNGIHKLMSYLQEQYMAMIDYLVVNNLLTLNNESDLVGSGGQGYTSELPVRQIIAGSGVKTSDLWVLSESQETVGVSPEMFNEFVLQYQIPILNRFGLICYGCCEPLHDRWQYIKDIPRLRRVSVSPWCDQEFMGDVLKGKAVFSRKFNPSLVCSTYDEQQIRKNVRNSLAFAKDCNLEIILKDTHTIHFQPERLRNWVKIVREEIENS